MSSLGDRFCYYRFDVGERGLQGTRSLMHGTRQESMRDDLKGAVAHLFDTLESVPEPSLSQAEIERLVKLADFTTLARSAVIRDGYTREIVLIPGAEAPGRFVGILQRVLFGLLRIGLERQEAWNIICRVCMDSMPRMRMDVYLFLRSQEASSTTRAVATSLDLPTTTARRTLQDLTAYKLVVRISQGEGRDDLWSPTQKGLLLYEEAFQDYENRSREVHESYGDENGLV
jgi:hypothetical protein